MKKTILALTLISSYALANEPAKEISLVVSNNNMIQSAAKSDSSGFKDPKSYKEIKITLLPGETPEEARERILQQGEYSNVEINIKTSNPTVIQEDASLVYATFINQFNNEEQSTPNDPRFSFQEWWFKPSEENLAWSEILPVYNYYKDTEKVRVGVIDGGFADYEDLNWVDGASFIAGTNPDEYIIDLDNTACENGHGQAVGSIIGSEQDNNIGMTGIVDAEMIAVRALNCGEGTLKGASDGIWWLSGAKLDGYRQIEPVDVINLSLGGETSCPSYLQDAIDAATEKGIVIVASAGNEDIDASRVSPASCKNVVTVAANNKIGHKAYFSNFGRNVDVTAQGERVIGSGKGNNYYLWSGTSFSGPIVAGIVAKQKAITPNLKPSEIENLLKASSTEYSYIYSGTLSCDGNRCGAGVANANRLSEMAQSYSEKSSEWGVADLLDSPERCDKNLYLEALGNAIDFCELKEVNVDLANIEYAPYYKLIELPKGIATKDLENPTVISESAIGKFITERFSFDYFDYAIQICDDENTCRSKSAIPLTEDLIKVDNACN